MAAEQPRRLVATFFLVSLSLAACGTPPGTRTPEPSKPAASPSGVETSANVVPAGCSDANPCALNAGTYMLTGSFAFLPGMTITVSDRWQSREQDAGEFNLWPIGGGDGHILMVRDIAAVRTDGSAKLAVGVPATVEGLTAYWRGDPNVEVSTADSTTIAGNLPATTYVIHVRPDAKYTDAACPAYPRCADLFTDPKHWGGGAFGIGAPEVVRLYLATIGSGANAHLFGIVLDANDDAALDRLTDVAAPIIDSIRLPATFPTY